MSSQNNFRAQAKGPFEPGLGNSEKAFRLVSSIEAASLLSISRRKLWSLTTAGEIEHVRIGRAVRYSIEALRKFANANTSGGAM